MFQSRRSQEQKLPIERPLLLKIGWISLKLVHIKSILFLSKRVYNLVAREARAQCMNRVLVLVSKLAALIFTCIYPMVSAMTSYGSLTSRCIFVSRQHSTESDFEFHHWMTKVFTKSRLFIVCKTMFTIGESQAISHANRTANTRTPNCQSSQGKIWHRKILWSENAHLKFSGPRNKDGDGINKQRSRGNITQWISNAKVL